MSLTDRVLRTLCRIGLAAFFRSVEVSGAQNIPTSGAVVVVANHHSSVVDGMLLLGTLERTPRFLASAKLFDIPLLATVLRAAGTVPLYRHQDGKAHVQPMSVALGRAAQILARGEMLALFPEGASHNALGLLPFKTGAARLAAQSVLEHGSRNTQIVPIGLVFERKNLWRSRVVVEIGEPVRVADELSPAGVAGHASNDDIVALTDKIRTSIEALLPEASSLSDDPLENLAEQALVTSVPIEPQSLRQMVADRKRIAERFKEGLDAPTTSLLRHYRQALLHNQVDDNDVHLLSTANPSIVLQAWSRIWRAPFVLLGVLLNWVPYRVVYEISRRQEIDKRSTFSILSGLLAFPIFWSVVVFVSATFTADWTARNVYLGMFIGYVLGPLTGLFMLNHRDWRQEHLEVWRRRRFLRRKVTHLEHLQELRGKVISAFSTQFL